MKLSQTAPPEGTVRDWLTSRAQTGGTAMTFPETNEDLSWQKLHQDAARIAGELTSQGLAKGESVAIVHPNGAEGITAFYAALYGGFRATMINLAAGPDAIAYALAHSEARTAFVHVDQRAMFDDVRPEHMNLHQPSQSTALLHDLSAADDALLMYTSGTTGRPKGVVHTHASPLAGGWTTTIAHKLGPEDRGFCVLPIYHINGLCVTVMGSLVSGGSLAMVSKFSASRFWAQCQAGGATWFSVVPTIISHLLHGQATPSATVMGKLRFGHSASSALAVETQNAFQKTLWYFHCRDHGADRNRCAMPVKPA